MDTSNLVLLEGQGGKPTEGELPEVAVDQSNEQEWAKKTNECVHGASKKQIPKLCDMQWSAGLSTLSSLIAEYMYTCHDMILLVTVYCRFKE